MPYTEAKAWQTRLRQMDEVHRQADRLVLLDINLTSHQPWLECDGNKFLVLRVRNAFAFQIVHRMQRQLKGKPTTTH